MQLNHISQELIDNICSQLKTTEGSLTGLGALFEQGASDSCFTAEELFGIGQLLKNLSAQLSQQIDLLRCGDPLQKESAQKSSSPTAT